MKPRLNAVVALALEPRPNTLLSPKVFFTKMKKQTKAVREKSLAIVLLLLVGAELGHKATAESIYNPFIDKCIAWNIKQSVEKDITYSPIGLVKWCGCLYNAEKQGLSSEPCLGLPSLRNEEIRSHTTNRW